ncbi:SMP-30/gluconolactonase/LRE family protein [Streptomyces sp. SID8379]|uniref:SMP-30/gluconolactonase/LRE family protein n=1 Tax=unclassified Streptomyces TaxID=2593676 RepID=UPI000375350A|nr:MULTISPECIES: SMP-30/gluconolactonase/LRE family protein [unclassified Streptomyces]MYW70126.1 SMP-30/gluconolactonase/LRE family protein [Streptomyces sp. SID8379]
MTTHRTHHTPRTLAGLAAAGLLALTGCGTQAGTTAAGHPAPSGEGSSIRAVKAAHLTNPHEATGRTLLEGPLLVGNRDLYVVDVTAPPGEPKLISLDVKSGKHRSVYTDRTGAYTSAQISPYDGRVYLTDFATGAVVSVEPDGTEPRTFFSGTVDGSRMTPDDAAFDDAGNLYVSDAHGTEPDETDGRIVRIDRDGTKATVLADGLAQPNGIMFDPERRGLWTSELTKDTVSYLLLDAEKTKVTNQHEAIHVNGGLAQTDSIAVDADGNLYQGLHGRPAMAVYNKYGARLATVEIPAKDADGLESATNVAITPGGTTAYMTVSGPDGGYIYQFTALAEGIRQSNGG